MPGTALNTAHLRMVYCEISPLFILFLIVHYCGFSLLCHLSSYLPAFAQIVPMTWNTLTYQVGRVLPLAQISSEAGSNPPGRFKCFFCCPCAVLWVHYSFIITHECVYYNYLPVSLFTGLGALWGQGLCLCTFIFLIKGLNSICWWIGWMTGWIHGRKKKKSELK